MFHFSAPYLHSSSVAYLLICLIPHLTFGKGTAGVDYCNVNCDNHEVHTMCMYPTLEPGPACKNYDKANSVLTTHQKEVILHFHNKLRSHVARGREKRGTTGPQPNAADMMELSWDEELEAIAQRYALQCTYDHDLCRDKADGSSVGQNLGVKAGSLSKYVSHLKLMFNEVKDFDRNLVHNYSKSEGPVTGHYTQLVWASTTSVGCAISRFHYEPYSEHDVSELLVCDYSPAGNWINDKIYTVGKPCSKCPHGMKCSKQYPGLCKNPKRTKIVSRTPYESKESFSRKFLHSRSSISEKSPPFRTNLFALVIHIAFVVEI